MSPCSSEKFVYGSTSENAGRLPDAASAEELLELDHPAVVHVVGPLREEQGAGRDVRVVVPPADAVLVEAVEDRAVRRVGGRDARRVGADVPERGAGDEEPAVRVRLGHHRAEVAVADREVTCHRVVEGDVFAGPVTHGCGAAGPHEPHVRPVVPTLVRGVPALRDAGARVPARVRVVEGPHVPAGGIGVVVDRRPARADGEPVSAPEHPEMVVEGVVLHHEHDDVLDLGHRVGAGGHVGERSAPRREQRSTRPEPPRRACPPRPRGGSSGARCSEPSRERAGRRRRSAAQYLAPGETAHVGHGGHVG